MALAQGQSLRLIGDDLTLALLRKHARFDLGVFSELVEVELIQALLVGVGQMVCQFGLGHACKSLILEHRHEGSHKQPLIPGALEQIIIVLEFLGSISFAVMLLLELLLSVKVNLNNDILNDKAGKVFIPLPRRKYFVLLGKIQLSHYDFHNLLDVALEVHHDLGLFLVSDQLIQPITPITCYLCLYALFACD